ncbi:MAG: hypothetical protein WD276_10350 [Actinomycetota bacterium]
MSEVPGRELIEKLEAAGRILPGAHPDFARSVADAVRERRRPRLPALAAWSRRRRVLAFAAAVLALAAIAAAAKITVGVVTIREVPEQGPAVPELDRRLGRPASLSEARAAVPGLAVPVETELGSPDSVFLDRDEGRATLAWTPREGLPSIRGLGWGLVLMEFRGDAPLVTKEVSAPVEEVLVEGEFGFWIEGPHALLLPDGTSLRISGNVLVWQWGELTVRLESELGKAESLDFAKTLA